MRLSVSLTEEEFRRLRELARAERRIPKDQAAWMIARALDSRIAADAGREDDIERTAMQLYADECAAGLHEEQPKPWAQQEDWLKADYRMRARANASAEHSCAGSAAPA